MPKFVGKGSGNDHLSVEAMEEINVSDEDEVIQ